MVNLDKGKKKRELCVKTHVYFDSINRFIALTARSLFRLRLVEAAEYLKSLEQISGILREKLKEQINDL